MRTGGGERTAPGVLEICAELIRRDSSNFGPDGSRGERGVADYIMQLLQGAGYRPALLESAPGRANVLLRVPGSGRSPGPALPGLLVHGHLDVVPVERHAWTVDPFGGEVREGYLYGRGAADMKGAVAAMLSVLLGWAGTGGGPRRDIVFAFVADEEEDGRFGAGWLVDRHPEWFAGVAAAIGESGGSPVPGADGAGQERTFYPIATAERGTFHMTLRATGPAGHGSRGGGDSAVLTLLDAVTRIARHRWPTAPDAAGRRFLRDVCDALGIAAELSTPDGMRRAMDEIGDPLARFVRPAAQCSANPTVLRAGYKVNVVPAVAEADVDVRAVPGAERELLARIDELIGPTVQRIPLREHPGVAAPIDSAWFAAMADAITRHDPGAIVVPFCMGGGTDAKAFSTLGIDCYGFTPLGRDPQGRIESGMHGADERVPVAALEAGVGILDTFLTTV